MSATTATGNPTGDPTGDPTVTPASPGSPAGTGGPDSPDDTGADRTTAALQTTLAAEHAAVFVYGALGGQASQSRQPSLYARVTRGYLVHRDRRDELTALLTAAGVEPAPADPGYALPGDLGSARAIASRARALEEQAASTYAFLVASSTGSTRAWAADALVDAAVRGLGFGGRPEDLPGL